jgi:hypothetical protein
VRFFTMPSGLCGLPFNAVGLGLSGKIRGRRGDDVPHGDQQAFAHAVQVVGVDRRRTPATPGTTA